MKPCPAGRLEFKELGVVQDWLASSQVYTFGLPPVVHQVRNSLNCVPHKDSRELLRDMKAIYQSSNLEQGEAALDRLADKWGKKYPRIVSSWQTNWGRLCPFLEYPEAIRRLIYTTNPIESLHSQLRKITKSKRSFPSDQALMKLLYLVQKDVTGKWTHHPVLRWKTIKAQLLLIFPDRINLDTLY